MSDVITSHESKFFAYFKIGQGIASPEILDSIQLLTHISPRLAVSDDHYEAVISFSFSIALIFRDFAYTLLL